MQMHLKTYIICKCIFDVPDCYCYNTTIFLYSYEDSFDSQLLSSVFTTQVIDEENTEQPSGQLTEKIEGALSSQIVKTYLTVKILMIYEDMCSSTYSK
jgi:hypothetical protein